MSRSQVNITPPQAKELCEIAEKLIRLREDPGGETLDAFVTEHRALLSKLGRGSRPQCAQLRKAAQKFGQSLERMLVTWGAKTYEIARFSFAEKVLDDPQLVLPAEAGHLAGKRAHEVSFRELHSFREITTTSEADAQRVPGNLKLFCLERDLTSTYVDLRRRLKSLISGSPSVSFKCSATGEGCGEETLRRLRVLLEVYDLLCAAAQEDGPEASLRCLGEGAGMNDHALLFEVVEKSELRKLLERVRCWDESSASATAAPQPPDSAGSGGCRSDRSSPTPDISKVSDHDHEEDLPGDPIIDDGLVDE